MPVNFQYDGIKPRMRKFKISTTMELEAAMTFTTPVEGYIRALFRKSTPNDCRTPAKTGKENCFSISISLNTNSEEELNSSEEWKKMTMGKNLSLEYTNLCKMIFIK
jgi:hypothetical protein